MDLRFKLEYVVFAGMMGVYILYKMLVCFWEFRNRVLGCVGVYVVWGVGWYLLKCVR